MFFWRKKDDWENEYDEYYTRDIERGGGKVRFRYLPHLLLLGFIGGVFCVVVGAVAGQAMLEKLVTSLVMPLGVLWLALHVMIYFCLINRQAWPAVFGFLCWIFLSVAGNSFFANWYANSIESPFLEVDAMQMEPLDVIVVLGGGTATALNGRPELSTSGDRIAQAACLWHAGQATELMCTGKKFNKANENDLHPYEEAALLLEGLGVKRNAILKLSGINTSEEMKNLKKWADANPEKKRIGILTSAWHLARAKRLAEAQGLNVVPIPSDFLGRHFSPEPGVVIPDSYNLMVTTSVTKEYLAGLVGR
jgi:uncharacterized SAM-binding protein YcdF (DUF218 family)